MKYKRHIDDARGKLKLTLTRLDEAVHIGREQPMRAGERPRERGSGGASEPHIQAAICELELASRLSRLDIHLPSS